MAPQSARVPQILPAPSIAEGGSTRGGALRAGGGYVGPEYLPTGESPSRYRDRSSRRFAWWYDHLVDWMLCNPGATYKDIGRAFNRSPGTVSLILSSDLFRARYAQRKAEHNRRLSDAI